MGVSSPALKAALSQVAFEHVRIVLRHDNGAIALDTTVTFPAGSDVLTLTLTVPLPPSTRGDGVELGLDLDFVNAAGDVVFQGGPLRVRVLPSTSTSGPPPTLQIPVHYTGPGANATRVVIAPKTVNNLAGQSVTFTAQAQGSDGTAIAGTPVVFSSSDASIVSINASTGVASLVARGTAKVYAQLLTGPLDSAVVSVTLPAARIALVSGDAQTAIAGSSLPLPVVARVTASDGSGVGGVTVTFAANGGGSVTPTSAVSAADGSVSTAWKLGTAASAQTMTASASGLSGSPITVNATALSLVASRLVVVTGPVSGKPGTVLPPVSVAAQDNNGNAVTTFTGDVSVAIGTNPGNATLGGTTTVKAVAGVATFSGLTLNRPGANYTLVFSSNTLSSVASGAFSIVTGDAANLAFGPMPASVDAGIAIAPAITVIAQDAAGNAVTSFTGVVSVAMGTNPGGVTLGGTLTQNAVAGVATFNNLTITKSGLPYTLTASAAGLTGATSAAFSVQTGPATGITIVSGSGQSAAAGSALSPITVRLHDAYGNGISSVPLAFAVTGGGGTLSAAVATTDANGTASVVWTIGTGPQTMTASYTGLSPITITASSTAGAATQLVITQQPPATSVAGVALAPALTVVAKDVSGNVVTSFVNNVTVAIGTNPAAGTLGGTTTQAAVAGVATFNNLSLNKIGTGYTLVFSAVGLTSATTSALSITIAAASLIAADSGTAQSGPTSQVLPVTLVAKVTDAFGNKVAGTNVAWAVATGGGALAGTTTTTDTAGRVRAQWTLGPTAGAQSVTATSAGLTGSPLTFIATAVGTSGPATLFLGYDFLNITTGAPTAVSVFLTAAQASPVTVSLSTLDTLSQWTTSSVVIPAGATSALASIIGRVGGSSLAVASAAGVGADTISLTVVQATVSLFNSSMYVGAKGDTLENRVILSAPAPAGGVTVSFDVSNQGLVILAPSPGTRFPSSAVSMRAPEQAVAAASGHKTNLISPTTVTIKAGETQAYFYVIGDTLAGSTSITPIATGYTSQGASVNVASRTLNFGYQATAYATIGSVVGQSADRGNNVQASLTINFTARTPGIVLVPAVAVISANVWSRQVSIIGASIGSTWVVASAAGYSSDSLFVAVRRPALKLSVRNLTAAAGSVPSSGTLVQVYDSTRTYPQYVATPVTVTATSSNPAVARPTDGTFMIDANYYNAQTPFTPVSAGTASIVYSAPGYLSDTLFVTVTGAAATASWAGGSTGTGQYVPLSFTFSDALPKATSFTLVSSNPAVAMVSGSLLLPAGTTYGEASRVVGISAGTATITWSAPGFRTDSASVTVTAARLYHTSPGSMTAGLGLYSFYVWAEDNSYSVHPVASDLTVTITSSDTNVVSVSGYSTTTIGHDSYLAYSYLVPKAAGTATITLTAPGYLSDAIPVTVAAGASGPPTITAYVYSPTVGRRQTTAVSVYRGGSSAATHVSIRKIGTATAVSDTAFNVPVGGTYLGQLAVSGLNVGTDSLIFSAPGHVSDTAVVRVTTPKLIVETVTKYDGDSQLSSALQNFPDGYLQVTLTDSLGVEHASMDTVHFAVTSSDSSVMRAGALVIAPSSSSVYTGIQFTGPGLARFRVQDLAGTYATDSTSIVTVQQPVLYFSNNTEPLYIGMRQRTDNNEAYVYTDYNVLVPTWIKLTRSTTALVSMPDSVLIPAGSNSAYFSLAGLDTVGGLQVQASAPGFASATRDIVVSRPGFNVFGGMAYTSQASTPIEVDAIETGGRYVRVAAENVTVSLTSSATSVGSIDLATVTIPAGSYNTTAASLVTNGPGTTVITASDARGIYQRYLPGTVDALIQQADFSPITEIWRLGVGQQTTFYAGINYPTPANVSVTFTGTGGHSNRTGTTVETVGSSTSYLTGAIITTSVGTDTLVLSAPGFRNGTRIVEVSQGTLAVYTAPLTMKVGDVVNLGVSLQTPGGQPAWSAGSTTMTLSATNAVWWDGASSVPSIVATDGVGLVNTAIKATAAGTATFTITAPGYLSRSFSVQVLP